MRFLVVFLLECYIEVRRSVRSLLRLVWFVPGHQSPTLSRHFSRRYVDVKEAPNAPAFPFGETDPC